MQGLESPTEAQLARIARSCWGRSEREWQYFACGYLRRHIGVASANFLTTARALIVTKQWWDTVDALATRTVGPLVQAYPSLRTEMDRWTESDDFWLARAAILHQLLYRQETDRDRLFAYCLRRAPDTEFFIRKAIGWALREFSKTDERAVRSFVGKHRDDLSALSLREAFKWLDRREARSTFPGKRSAGPPQRRTRAESLKS
jgi:3-methyladenine DNA glycosylase AlkD